MFNFIDQFRAILGCEFSFEIVLVFMISINSLESLAHGVVINETTGLIVFFYAVLWVNIISEFVDSLKEFCIFE